MKLPTTKRTSGSDDQHNHTAMTRPSDGEMSFFENCFKELVRQKSDARVLILGCSPELRELAARMNIRATVIANDLEVIERTSKLMKKKNKAEEWLEGDIIKLPIKKASFDMIFSDHILSNVAPFNTAKFYERMKDILKNDGSVVMRSLVFSKTAKLFESRVTKYFNIVEKKFAKTGVFAEYFPIYSMKPK